MVCRTSKVARRVRAWIETSDSLKKSPPRLGSPVVCGRGLKRARGVPAMIYRMSPVVCGRGLKPAWVSRPGTRKAVARRVRAWIETSGQDFGHHRHQVARRVRAWIETASAIACCTSKMFVARRVRAWIETRGGRSPRQSAKVARRVRAWIETTSETCLRRCRWSPVVCGRGLKHRPLGEQADTRKVARRVRAWIETTTVTKTPQRT